MVRLPLAEKQTLRASPVAPDAVELWYEDLCQGLDLLVHAVEKAWAIGETLKGFELLTEEEAFERILDHLQESEKAAVFQLLACAEAQLNHREQAAGPLIKARGKRRSSRTTGDGLAGIVARIAVWATSTADTEALRKLAVLAAWRGWYAHGRRFDVEAPDQPISVDKTALIVRDAIANAEQLLNAAA